MIDDYDRERAERYLGIAADMDRRAMRSGDPDVADAYRHIAASWRKLADEAAPQSVANEEPRPDDGDEPDQARA